MASIAGGCTPRCFRLGLGCRQPERGTEVLLNRRLGEHLVDVEGRVPVHRGLVEVAKRRVEGRLGSQVLQETIA